MGRRYGRNQKRRHREKIAELEKTQDRLLKKNTLVLRNAQTVEKELKLLVESIDAICPLSAILKPKTKVMNPDQLRYGEFEYTEMDHGPYVSIGDADIPQTMPLRTVRRMLYEIIAEVQNNPVTLRQAIHLIARSPTDSQAVSYFVDMTALRQSRSMQHVYDHIIKTLANKLAMGMARV